jgi:hypothetical protein
LGAAARAAAAAAQEADQQADAHEGDGDKEDDDQPDLFEHAPILTRSAVGLDCPQSGVPRIRSSRQKMLDAILGRSHMPSPG